MTRKATRKPARKPARTKRQKRAADIETLTEAQYQRAAQMVQNGAFEPEIRHVCELTAAQWQQLKHRGVPSRGWRALSAVQAEETAAAIGAGREAAQIIGGDAGDRLRAASVICGNAQMIVNEILTQVGSKIVDNARQQEPASLDSVMPGGSTINLLKALSPYADPGKIADAFSKMFGERPGVAAIPGAKRDTVEGMQSAAAAMLREQAGDRVADAAAEALMTQVLSWSEDQLNRFLETGEEPAENEVGHAQTH